VNYAQLIEVAVFINGVAVDTPPDLEPYAVSVEYNINDQYQPRDVVFNNNEISVTGTNGTSNLITCASTTALTVGQPVVFFGTGFGGISNGVTYFVLTIASGTQFSITAIAGSSSPVVLTTASGSLTAQPQGTYYRAVQAVPPGISLSNTVYWLPFVPSLNTKLTLNTGYNANDSVAVLVLGDANSIIVTDTLQQGNAIVLLGSVSTLSVGQTVTFSGYSLGGIDTTVDYEILTIVDDSNNAVTITQDGVTEVSLIDDQALWSGQFVAKFTPTNYQSWSTPVTETFVVDANIQSLGEVVVSQVPSGTNPANMIVMVNGLRLIGPSCIEWTGDNTTLSFGLPQRLGVSFLQNDIDAVNDIQVYVDNVLQKQAFGAESGVYTVTNWDGSNTPGRLVVFDNPPDTGSKILIAVSTLADCLFAYNPVAPSFSSELQIVPPLNINDVIEVITLNNTAQQNILTVTFEGPTQIGVVTTEPYDTTDYDSPTNNDPFEVLPGIYDAEIGTSITANNFDLQRNNIDGRRLWVTLDGQRIFQGTDFSIDGQYLILASGVIGTQQQLVVTEFTNSVVPEAVAFRIFQDMRGVQATYRITNATTTAVAQAVTAVADTIYVDNAAALSEPDLAAGFFGIITIGGERIMYRNRDLVNNTISGLRRGTAGTAAAAHAPRDPVYDLGRGNLLSQTYQDYIVTNANDSGQFPLGDGTTTVFYAPKIDVSDLGDSSSIYVESIEVYVGGIRQYNVNQIDAESEYRYFVTDFGPLAIEFDGLAPAAGSQVTILQRRGVSWYQPGISTASDGVALQETNTTAARFLCDR
jgi:hypothetical protein